jgi:ribosome biogenesis GTPase A
VVRRSKKTRINYELGDNIHDEVHTNRINWFPGHMNKAIRQIKERLKKVDIVLEIRDARSPLVTGNKAVHEAIGEKGRLIVINKTNLADPKTVKLWQVWFEAQGVPFIFVNCFDKTSLNKIILNAKKVIHSRWKQSNPDKEITRKSLRMIILGLPNTGKSTIINLLAKRTATKTADRPGLTQQQIWIKVDGELELLDTPGVMPPKIDKHEHGLWLSALNAIPDKVVQPEVPACFIIEHFLKIKSEAFKNRYNLESLDTDLVGVLDHIGKLRGCIRHKGEIDYDRVYKIILLDFRHGDLGPVSLGIPPLPRIKK